MSDNPLPGQLALFSVTTLCKPDPERLKALKAEALLCHKCDLRRTCKQVVFGTGRVDRPQIAFIGESPGLKEDARGVPFIGPSGDMLRNMISAMKLKLEDMYLVNIVACCPPDSRPPTREESSSCRDWFVGQLRFTQPRTLVALGAGVANVMLETRKPEPLAKLRGVWHDWQGIPLRVTFPLAHLQRTPLDKAYAWNDLQEVSKKLSEVS